jgi:hemoglobin
MPDLTTIEDIQTVVDAFYDGMADDPVLGRFFADVDMEAHKPRLYAFWASVVFQTGTYRGRPFDAHLRLGPLEARHFERWLTRFAATVDAHFAGEAAERMKQKARQIAVIFQVKLGIPESDLIVDPSSP